MRIRQTAMAGAQPLGGRTGIYACISGFARVAQPPSAVRFSLLLLLSARGAQLLSPRRKTWVKIRN